MATNTLTPFPYTITGVTNISPLTYRDAATFLEQLETLKNWIATVNIPEINTILDGVVAEATAGIENAEATVTAAKEGWETLFSEFMVNVSANIGLINEAVIASQVAGKLDATAAATTYATKTENSAKADAADVAESFAELKRDPLQYWKDAVQDQGTVPALYVNLGDSIANGGNPQRAAFAWLSRVTALYTNRIFDRLDAVALPVVQPNGVQVYNGAVGGKTSANYLTDALVNRIGVIQPQLISHMVKANDQTAQIAPAQYKQNIKTWIEKIQVVSPASLHILINQHNRYDLINPMYSGDAYAAELESLAAEMGNKVLYLDIGKEFKNHGMPNTNRYGLFDTDNLHFDNSGNRVYAEIIGQFIGAPTPDYIPREMNDAWNFATGATLNSSSSPLFASFTIKPKPYIRQGVATFNIFGISTGNVDANIAMEPNGGASQLIHVNRLTNGLAQNHVGSTPITFEANTEYLVTLKLGIYNADTFNPTNSTPVYFKFFSDISPA